MDKKKKHILLFLLSICLVIQLPSLFRGIDLCDTGFYMTFYNNIFTHPNDVSYNFMYYLSGLVGAITITIFHNSIFTIKILGIICNLTCVYIVFNDLFRPKNIIPLICGLILTTIGYSDAPAAFYNDTLTVTMTVVSVSILIRGLNKDNIIFLYFSGLILGINVFSRIPNICNFLFLLIIIYEYYINRKKGIIKRLLIFLAGWITGISSIIFLMLVLDHLPIFIDVIDDIIDISNSSTAESSHSILNLFATQIANYFLIFKTIVYFIVGYGAFILSKKYIKNKALIVLIGAAIITLLTYKAYKLNFNIFLAALSFVGCLIVLIFGNKKLRLYSLAGILMIIIIPVGSDSGLTNTGAILFWYAIPISFICLSTIKIKTKYFTISRSPTFINLFTSALILMRVFVLFFNGFYFDSTPLVSEAKLIDSDHAVYIHTSPSRALIINEILNDVKGNVPVHTKLMVYGSGPMINYLTDTRPALGCSWPELLTSKMLKSKLNNEGPIPFVLLLKFNTIGNDFSNPSESFSKGLELKYNNVFHNEKKSKIIIDYLSCNNYKLIEDNSYYSLYSFE